MKTPDLQPVLAGPLARLLLGALLAGGASGCLGLPMLGGVIPGAGAGDGTAWSMQRSPHGVGQSQQGVLVVPAMDNAAQSSVFEELGQLQAENVQLQGSVDSLAAQSSELQSSLASRSIELRAAQAELTALRGQMNSLSTDLASWKAEVARNQQQLADQHGRDLQALDQLIGTVESILGEAGGVPVSPRANIAPGQTPTSVPGSTRIPRPNAAGDAPAYE